MPRPITAAAYLCALALAACGGDDKPDDEAQVRATLTTFAKAVEDRDYDKLCDEVFAPELLEGLQSIGLPCAVAMKNSLGDVEAPKLTVGTITIDKDEADADIKSSATGQPPASNTLHLVKVDGKWRVSALSDAQSTEGEDGATPEPAAPTPTSG